MFLEQIRDLIFGFMQHRRYDMRWRLMRELQNILTQIGLNHLHASGF